MKRHAPALIVILCGVFAALLTCSTAFADEGSAAVSAAAPAQVAPAAAAPAPDAGSQVAPAPAPALPDPVADPIAAGSEIYKLYKSGGLLPSIIVGLFLLVTFLRAKIKWLATGYRAVIVMGLLGTLTILVEPASRGTTPTLGMVLSAIGAGVLLALKWKPADALKV